MIVVFGFILALSLFHITIFSPVVEQVRGLRDRIAQERQVVEKLRKKLSEADQIKERLSKSQQELTAIREKLFPSSDPYQLASKLEEALSTGDKKDIVIKSYQVVSSRELGLYQEVQYSISIDTNIYGLSQFLSWINNYSSSVRVGEFNIRYAPRSGKESSVDLIVNMTLTVFMQKKG
ncbi:MAG: type 4a pilus biogenesis protein PilO [Syntrophobacterales bacterium]|nr:type 4a pilus biogenesis protein PilO [Syntrophobacterales bacterium]